MNYNCPICNKAGLPDYTKTEVVCPQCNSDLKSFLLLHSISTFKKGKVIPYLTVVFSLLAVVFLCLFFRMNSTKNELVTKNTNLTNSNVCLADSVIQLNNTIIKFTEATENQVATITYTVKKGDYLYKIAHFFYGDGSKYKQIEADNNLVQPYTLRVGQVLTIKIPQ
jgi:nucleoid-associated protein YgaU